MTDELLPFAKEKQVRRVWHCKAGDEDCTYEKPCRPCLGRRNRRKGQAKQRAAAKALGIPSARFRGQNADEENWRGLFRAEAKSGKQVESLAARFLAAEKQSDGNKAHGDTRPFAFVAMPDGWGSEGIVAVRLTAWRTHIVPLTEEAG